MMHYHNRAHTLIFYLLAFFSFSLSLVALALDLPLTNAFIHTFILMLFPYSAARPLHFSPYMPADPGGFNLEGIMLHRSVQPEHCHSPHFSCYFT